MGMLSRFTSDDEGPMKCRGRMGEIPTDDGDRTTGARIACPSGEEFTVTGDDTEDVKQQASKKLEEMGAYAEIRK